MIKNLKTETLMNNSSQSQNKTIMRKTVTVTDGRIKNYEDLLKTFTENEKEINAISKRIEEGNLIDGIDSVRKYDNLNEYDKHCHNWFLDEYVRRESDFYDDLTLPSFTKEELEKIVGK